jgi:acyl-CoA synthetase (AMP-forming)/AMP-acid ligase II
VTLFPQQVLDALGADPDRVAFEQRDRLVTGGEVLATTDRIVRSLRAAGLGPGRAVAMSTMLTPEAYAAHLAVHALGCLVLAVRPAWSHRQLATTLSGRIDAVVGDPTTLSPALLALAPKPDAVLSVGALPGAIDVLGGSRCQAGPRAHPAKIVVEARPDDIARLNFTSGSTGVPNACARSYETFSLAFRPECWAPDVARLIGTMDRLLVHGDLSMPIALTFAARCLITGGTVVLGDDGPQPDLAHAIERHRASGVVVPPPLLHRLLVCLGDEAIDLGSLRAIVVTGSVASPGLLAAAVDRLGPVVWQGYGQAESGMLSLLTPDDIKRHGDEALASVGRPLPDIELQVRDPDEGVLPAGQTGEIWVRSPFVMAGYWEDERQSSEVMRDGWLNTHDLGCIDAATGLLHLRGRSRDVIMVNAEVCYAAAIERVLAVQHGVAQAYVVGVLDEGTGEAVHAFVIPREPSLPDTSALASAVRCALTPNHVPVTITILRDVPVTAGGKPDKRALAELALQRADPARANRATG